jgi:NADPH-dependent curcumin reductase CurA
MIILPAFSGYLLGRDVRNGEQDTPPASRAEWRLRGCLKYGEDIADRLEHAPAAFLGLLQRKNVGETPGRVAS